MRLPKPTAMTALALLLLAGGAYVLLAPRTVNGDGIGYLKQIETTDLSPGHLAYLPLIRRIAAVWPHEQLIDLVSPLRALSTISALVALLVFFSAVRRSRRDAVGALFCTALLAASHAFFRAAQEVEVYGLATLLVVCLLAALLRYREAALLAGRCSWSWAATAALLAGLAPSVHLTLALLAPSTLLLLWRWGGSRRDLVVAAAILATCGLMTLLLALRHVGIPLHDVPAAWRWLRGADHGIPYPLSPLNLLVAGWGLAKSLVAIPYLHEASIIRVVVLSAVAVASWCALLLAARRPRPVPPAPHGLGLRFVLLFGGPLALFGVFFYPSDTERWVFLMPAACLALAPASRHRLAHTALLAVVLLNLGQRLPAAIDDSETVRARQAESVARGSNNLVVSPGHGWDEMIGLFFPRPPERFPLVFFAGAERSLPRALALMRQRIAAAFARGGRVYVARLHDPIDARGFKDLHRTFQLSAAGFAAALHRYQPRRVASVDGLWQLSPAAPTQRDR